MGHGRNAESSVRSVSFVFSFSFSALWVVNYNTVG